MKKQIKKLSYLVLIAAMLSLSACGSNEDNAENGETLQAVDKNDYASLLPYQSSDSSQMHAASLSTDMSDTFTVGAGLMELSKEHFSPSTHTFREGVFLDYDTLDAVADRSGLLGRYSKDKKNTPGLNPEIGTKFPTEDGNEVAITASDILLLDIFEYDWYESKELKGISLGFVFNDKIGDSVNPSTIQKEKLNMYAEEAAIKAVNYLRKKVPEIGNDMPIYVAFYNMDSNDAALPGTFFREAYFKTKVNGTFESINEAWQLFPTTEAAKYDGTTSTSFDRFKANFKDIMPQDVSMVGKGHYRDSTLQELRINVTLHARSSGEVKTAIQLLNDKLSLFSTSYSITVDISSDNTHAAVIKREKGSSQTTVITLI